jgi:hypothetical protein
MDIYIFKESFKGIKDGIMKNILKPKEATEVIHSICTNKLKDTLSYLYEFDKTGQDIIAVVDLGISSNTKINIFGDTKDITFIPLYLAYTDNDMKRINYAFASKKLYLSFNGFKLECNSNLNLIYEALKRIDNNEYFEIYYGNPQDTKSSELLYSYGEKDIIPSKSFHITEIDKKLDGYFIDAKMVSL